jgi:tetratricopeptide (TPR) repeat protein
MRDGPRLLATRPEHAVRVAEQRLQFEPGDAAAQLLLGAAHRRCGALDKAEVLLRELASRQPAAWGVWHELGVTLALRGSSADAVGALRRAVELNPNALLATAALADLLALTCDGMESDRALSHAARLRDRPDLHGIAGDLDLGPPEVERLASAGLDANDPVSAGILGQLSLDAGRGESAERWLTAAASRWPAYAPLRRTLALAQLAQQRGPAALKTVRALLGTHPPPGLRGLLADALVQAREDAEAHEVLETMVAERPDQVRAWIALGHVRKTLGESAGAAEAYRRAIAHAPDCGEAYAGLANLKVEAFDDAEVASMRRQLARPDLQVSVRADLHFALATALEARNEVGAAFEQYHRANALRRQERPHDASAHARFVTRSCEVLTREVFDARAGQGCPVPSPIFVVGLPRAGSTLVEQILACHPDVEGCDELPILPAIAREAVRRAGGREADYPQDLTRLDPATLRSLGEAYLAGAAPYRKLARPRFVDKFPGNVLHLGLISLILPNARIVDVRRDPEACCLSLFRQNFAEGQNYSYDLTDLGRYYRDYVRLMDHMTGVLPRQPVRVRHEALSSDPERQIRRLLAALDLSFHPACLRPHESTRLVRTASAGQVRRPISAAGLDQWRAYEPWLEPLYRGLNEAP